MHKSMFQTIKYLTAYAKNKLDVKFPHIHYWKTTHVNTWQHPTKQECKCGLTRSFEYKKHNVKGPLWKQGQWAWSDGTISEYRK